MNKTKQEMLALVDKLDIGCEDLSDPPDYTEIRDAIIDVLPKLRTLITDSLPDLAMQETDLESLKENVCDAIMGERNHGCYAMPIISGTIDHLLSQGRITCKQNATTKGSDDV